MKIKLDDKYFLTSDKRNYMITSYPTISKKGIPEADHFGYYTSIDHALQGFTNLKLRLSDCFTWKEVKALLVDLKRLYSEIASSINLGAQNE